MSILDKKKYFEFIPKMMDQWIFKNIFLTSSYQIPKNFPKKLKTLVEYLFRTGNFVNFFFFETVKPEKNSNFLNKGQMVISVGNQKISRFLMTKRTSPLESSREI